MKFFQNWLVKAFTIIIVPFIIGIIDNLGSWKNENGQLNNIFYNGKIFVMVLTILYIIYVIYIAYVERRKNKEEMDISELKALTEKQLCKIKTYDKVLTSINTIINNSQKEINKMASGNNLRLDDWNFECVSSYICDDIVEILKNISTSGEDISVNIYIRFKKKNVKRNNDYIRMIAHSGGTNSEPSILYKDIQLKKGNDWQYAKLFLRNNPKIIVYPSEEEIKSNFHFNGDPNNYLGEYTQYIGIPISCSSGRILSSLEIVSHHGTIIAETKDEILEIINKYLMVYRNYALLTHKIEKGFQTKRSDVNNKGE